MGRPTLQSRRRKYGHKVPSSPALGGLSSGGPSSSIKWSTLADHKKRGLPDFLASLEPPGGGQGRVYMTYPSALFLCVFTCTFLVHFGALLFSTAHRALKKRGTGVCGHVTIWLNR